MSSRPSSSIGTQSISAPTRSRQLLPGDDVGVVLHLGEDDAVALAEVGVAPGARDQVDRLGRVADEDDLAPVGRAEVIGDRRPRALVGRRRLGRERVRAAVDVGVMGALVAVDRLDRGQHPLGAGAAVEVGDRAVRGPPAPERERRREPSRSGRSRGERSSWSSSAPCSRGQALAPAATSSRIQP